MQLVYYIYFYRFDYKINLEKLIVLLICMNFHQEVMFVCIVLEHLPEKISDGAYFKN